MTKTSTIPTFIATKKDFKNILKVLKTSNVGKLVQFQLTAEIFYFHWSAMRVSAHTHKIICVLRKVFSFFFVRNKEYKRAMLVSIVVSLVASTDDVIHHEHTRTRWQCYSRISIIIVNRTFYSIVSLKHIEYHHYKILL